MGTVGLSKATEGRLSLSIEMAASTGKMIKSSMEVTMDWAALGELTITLKVTIRLPLVTVIMVTEEVVVPKA